MFLWRKCQLQGTKKSMNYYACNNFRAQLEDNRIVNARKDAREIHLLSVTVLVIFSTSRSSAKYQIFLFSCKVVSAIIKRRIKHLFQNLSIVIQVQAATKVPSAITRTSRLNDMTAVSVPHHQARIVRYEIFIWTNLFHLSMQGLGLYCSSQPHVHLPEPGRKLLPH